MLIHVTSTNKLQQEWWRWFFVVMATAAASIQILPTHFSHYQAMSDVDYASSERFHRFMLDVIMRAQQQYQQDQLERNHAYVELMTRRIYVPNRTNGVQQRQRGMVFVGSMLLRM